MKKITLTNDFHNTELNVVPQNGKLSVSQIKRAKRALCGVSGCACSGDIGTRGRQNGFEIEPLFNGRTGQIIGAYIHTI